MSVLIFLVYSWLILTKVEAYKNQDFSIGNLGIFLVSCLQTKLRLTKILPGFNQVSFIKYWFEKISVKSRLVSLINLNSG